VTRQQKLMCRGVGPGLHEPSSPLREQREIARGSMSRRSRGGLERLSASARTVPASDAYRTMRNAISSGHGGEESVFGPPAWSNFSAFSTVPVSVLTHSAL